MRGGETQKRELEARTIRDARRHGIPRSGSHASQLPLYDSVAAGRFQKYFRAGAACRRLRPTIWNAAGPRQGNASSTIRPGFRRAPENFKGRVLRRRFRISPKSVLLVGVSGLFWVARDRRTGYGNKSAVIGGRRHRDRRPRTRRGHHRWNHLRTIAHWRPNQRC